MACYGLGGAQSFRQADGLASPHRQVRLRHGLLEYPLRKDASMPAQRYQPAGLVEQLPLHLQAWLTLERFHLHAPHLYQRRERDPGFDPKYLPQNCDVFQLPCVLVPRRRLYMFEGGQQDSEGLAFAVDDQQRRRVLFPMHPSSVALYRDSFELGGMCHESIVGAPVWALPTSSTRTVLAWPGDQPAQAMFIKTSLHSPLFGDRRVTRIRAGRSVSLSAMVQAELGELPATLNYLPEPLAFTPRREPFMGAIVRAIPREIRAGRVLVAPLFSLIGGSDGHVPLLLTILERTGMTPMQFLHDVLCRPFARLWLDLTLNHGLVIEAHGQDLLLVLSPGLVPQRRFYYRDFEGLQVDWELRRHLGKPPPPMLAGQWCWHDAYDTWGDHRYAHLAWYKWRVSLTQYMSLVLQQVETALREWHRSGRLGGVPPAVDEATSMFSQCLFETLEQMFGVRTGQHYNVHRSLNRFLILLAGLRRELLVAHSSRRSSPTA
jgi:hypothetical protein